MVVVAAVTLVPVLAVMSVVVAGTWVVEDSLRRTGPARFTVVRTRLEITRHSVTARDIQMRRTCTPTGTG